MRAARRPAGRRRAALHARAGRRDGWHVPRRAGARRRHPRPGPAAAHRSGAGMTARVLVVEDHPLFRKGVVALLDAVADLAVVGTAASGEEAVDRVAELAPDVVLMDLQLPGMSGIEATRAIVAAQPQAGVLVLTLFEDEESVFLALRAGARGYVLKDADEEELMGAIRAVHRGEAIFSRGVAERVLAYFAAPRPTPKVFPTLTDREREILGLIAQGRPNP